MAQDGNDEKFMAMAVDLARTAFESKQGRPFGAVIVRDGEVIASAHNETVARTDITAHAEMLVLRRASGALGTMKLSECDLYTSGFPCPMCLSAIHLTGIRKVFFACNREDAAEVGFDDTGLYAELAKPHDRQSVPMVHVKALHEAGRKCFEDWAKER